MALPIIPANIVRTYRDSNGLTCSEVVDEDSCRSRFDCRWNYVAVRYRGAPKPGRPLDGVYWCLVGCDHHGPKHCRHHPQQHR